MALLAHFIGTSRLDIDDIVWQKEYFNVPKAKNMGANVWLDYSGLSLWNIFGLTLLDTFACGKSNACLLIIKTICAVTLWQL